MDGDTKEQLREWLVRSLEPVCDADPEVLSKYVLALIQNDPNSNGARQICVSKLEEFLGEETEAFVDRLFHAIQTGEYDTEKKQNKSREENSSHRQDKLPMKEFSDRRRNREEDNDRQRFQKQRRNDSEYMRDAHYPRGNDRYMPYHPHMRHRNAALIPDCPPPMNMWGPPLLYPPRPPHYHEYPPLLPDNSHHNAFMPLRTLPFHRNPRPIQSHPEPIAKTTLRISHIDPKSMNMTKLSLHFSKFGTVINVQMRPNYTCAYIQYATEEEAQRAYQSPIPVCNNRFIKVKWAKYDVKISESKSEKPVDSDNISDQSPEKVCSAAMEKGRKILEEKRELLEKQKQLIQQKSELIKRQLSQQKEILERVTKNEIAISVDEKREMLNKILLLSEELKLLQNPNKAEKIDGLKKELERLETACDGSHSRNNTSSRRAHSRQTQGRFRKLPRHCISRSLDNRTTVLELKNVPEKLRDTSVLEQHFGNFGGIANVYIDGENAFIKFQQRREAQMALVRGRVVNDTILEMNWVEHSNVPNALKTEEVASEKEEV